jgi:ubiquinone/menaquinone biosynthesis C-methylase UbiE
MPAAQPKPWKGMGMEGRIARWYASTRQKDMEEFRNQAKAVAERLDPGASVLEVAPGPGFFSVELAKLVDFKITGLDISRTMVEIAAENARKAGVKVDFRVGSASDIPFKDESFDFVYCSAAFKNFTEPVNALNEMYRVLRPAGEALIVDLNRDCPVREIDAYIERSGRSRIDAWMTKWTFRRILLKRAYSTEEFRRMSQESRFGTCKVESDGIGIAVRFAKACVHA